MRGILWSSTKPLLFHPDEQVALEERFEGVSSEGRLSEGEAGKNR
jgi:hypothetical protein